MPPGYDFAAEFVAGLREKLSGHPPEAMARLHVFVNTRRVRQGIQTEFADGRPGFFPRLRLVTDLAVDPGFPDIPGPVSSLRRRLELSQAVARLLENDERFGSSTAVHDLADSLADLLDEMHSEGVGPDRIRGLDVSEHSEHWARSLEFIDIVEQHWGLNAIPDMQARQRLVVESLTQAWISEPPDHPVIVAGSTGSRGATQLLMKAVANLPQGAVVIPCFDFAMPMATWDAMADSTTGEDHPQYRIKCLLDNLGITADDVDPWRAGATGNSPRHRLVSLALRPAPVTDQWMREGPALENTREATRQMTLLEAPGPRQEAVAIALCLRNAVENGQRAALVTPDRNLARQVTAALRRWDINPFDSFGESLLQTVPGRFLHAIANMMGRAPDPVPLIGLLKHPLTHSAMGRDRHLRMTGRLELALRRRDPNSTLETIFAGLQERQQADPKATQWISWLRGFLDAVAESVANDLSQMLKWHSGLAAQLACGSEQAEGGISRDTVAGRAALDMFAELDAESDAAGPLACEDYLYLFRSIAARKVVWQPFNAHPLVSIWDTLDARMQSPDIVIAGGLNNGVWPAQARPDPWLNRDMRKQAGLLLPERRTGLLAHDFQQVISARTVVLTRSIHNRGAPTVPSRWLSRLISLLAGIEGEGAAALAAMRTRGTRLLDRVRQMEEPAVKLIPEPRPAPRPPKHARPTRLSVTAIKTLITDPYEIYARHVLGLRELSPLGPGPELSLRGSVVHDIMHRLIAETANADDDCTVEKMMEIAVAKFGETQLPPHAKKFWIAQLNHIAEDFVRQELERRARGSPWLLEQKAEIDLPGLGFKLTARADRIDRDGRSFLLYDYKTGSIPTKRQVATIDKQIPLTAKMLELGGFAEIGDGAVRHAAYIAVGRESAETEVVRWLHQDIEMFDTFDIDWNHFLKLIERLLDERTPFIARRNIQGLKYGDAYHHLARFGEWDDTSGVNPDFLHE